MKVLDVSDLHTSLDETIQAVNKKMEELEAIEKSIIELINLDGSFTGKGAAAIKSYYQSCHQPFLFKLKQMLTTYKTKLTSCKNQLDGFEHDHTGYINQEFLQGELTNKLTAVQNYTNDVTADANQYISNVTDIVSIDLLDDEEVNQQVEQAKKSINDTITNLKDFDGESTSSLEELNADVSILSAYLEDLNATVAVNPRSLENFHPLQALMNPTHALLMGSIRSTPMNLVTNGSPVANHSTQSIYAFQSYTTPYKWLGLNFSPTTRSTTEEEVEKTSPYLTGDSVQRGDFTFEAGAGKVENDWSGYGDGDGQLGGSSKLTGIHSGVKHDTGVMDSSFDLQIGAAEAQASVGGQSIFPLVKAGGTVYAAEVKTQLDDEIDYVGRTGIQAKGELLKANAYAGVDNASVGFAAKASLAEGEVSGILPIPFTDYNFKGTVGGSAGGIGGEASIGKETTLDLRFILGIKLGISFEKAE